MAKILKLLPLQLQNRGLFRQLLIVYFSAFLLTHALLYFFVREIYTISLLIYMPAHIIIPVLLFFTLRYKFQILFENSQQEMLPVLQAMKLSQAVFFMIALALTISCLIAGLVQVAFADMAISLGLVDFFKLLPGHLFSMLMIAAVYLLYGALFGLLPVLVILIPVTILVYSLLVNSRQTSVAEITKMEKNG